MNVNQLFLDSEKKADYELMDSIVLQDDFLRTVIERLIWVSLKDKKYSKN